MLQLTQIPELYKQALALQTGGNGEAALGIYSQILAVKPDVAEVHFQVGRIFYDGNKFAKAIKHFKLALQIKPNEPGIWNAYIPALLCNIDPDEIKSAAKALKKTTIDPKVTIDFQNRLLNTKNGSSVPIGTLDKDILNIVQAAMVQRDFTTSNAHALTLHKKNPRNAVVAELLARTFDGLGNLDQARKYFKLAISLDPQFYNAYNNYGQTELAVENIQVTIPLFKSAIIAAPHGVSAIINLAKALAHTGNASDARQLLMNAKKLHLKGGKFDLELCEQFAHAGDYEAAKKYAKAAINREKSSVSLHTDIGDSFRRASQLNIAMKYYKLAYELDEKNPEILYRISAVLRELGDFDGSLEKIRAAIEIAPQVIKYLESYTSVQKVVVGDPLIDHMIEIYNNPSITIKDRTDLGFAIVKALEDTKQYNDVFNYLKLANNDMHERYPFDLTSTIAEVDAIKEYFADFKLINYKGLGDPKSRPIFVCGMPRSGTTLVEQIISAHSDVTGAGEVGYTSLAEERVLVDNNNALIPLERVKKSHLKRIGSDIWGFLQHLHPGSVRISDKSIQSYKRMGMLKAAMPNCKIIVVRRDPRDNLLSIYRNKFTDGSHLYAYDLTDLGGYYKQFVRVIDFWRQKMPEGFMEIQYEDLIDDPEKHARELIDYCDLEWQDECLNFHKSKRQVKTLSVYQVRQPIYKSSVKAWQRYEDDLKPLFEALK